MQISDAGAGDGARSAGRNGGGQAAAGGQPRQRPGCAQRLCGAAADGLRRAHGALLRRRLCRGAHGGGRPLRVRHRARPLVVRLPPRLPGSGPGTFDAYSDPLVTECPGHRFAAGFMAAARAHGQIMEHRARACACGDAVLLGRCLHLCGHWAASTSARQKLRY